jgi:hypothetical protein
MCASIRIGEVTIQGGLAGSSLNRSAPVIVGSVISTEQGRKLATSTSREAGALRERERSAEAMRAALKRLMRSERESLG